MKLHFLAFLFSSLVLLSPVEALAEHDYDKHTSGGSCFKVRDDPYKCVSFSTEYREHQIGAIKSFIIQYQIANHTDRLFIISWDLIDKLARGGDSWSLVRSLTLLEPGEKKIFIAESFEVPIAEGSWVWIFEEGDEEMIQTLKNRSGFSTSAHRFYFGNPTAVRGFIPKSWLKP